jgi:hypothetical protein
MVSRLATAAPDSARIATQIAALPVGAQIQLRLKNKHKMSGTRGVVSNSGFAFAETGSGESQVAFDDIQSVKQIGAKSHTTRNILIGVGIGVVAVAVALAIAIKASGPFVWN